MWITWFVRLLLKHTDNENAYTYVVTSLHEVMDSAEGRRTMTSNIYITSPEGLSWNTRRYKSQNKESRGSELSFVPVMALRGSRISGCGGHKPGSSPLAYYTLRKFGCFYCVNDTVGPTTVLNVKTFGLRE